MSFREKQAQVRLARAQELLATTESKVVEVALESGYQSLSLFNLMFKRRFGMTPARWRDHSRNGERGEEDVGSRSAKPQVLKVLKLVLKLGDYLAWVVYSVTIRLADNERRRWSMVTRQS